jgi:hypothetical protein
VYKGLPSGVSDTVVSFSFRLSGGRKHAVEVKKPEAAEIAPDWLKPYCKQLLSNLADQGCTSATLRTHERVAAAFCQEVRRRGLRKDELVRETLAKVHTATLNTFCPNKFLYKRFCLDRLSPCWSMRSPQSGRLCLKQPLVLAEDFGGPADRERIGRRYMSPNLRQ